MLIPNEIINVCTSVDRKFYKYLPVMIRSVISNTRSDVSFYILFRDIEERKLEKLIRGEFPKLSIKYIDMNPFFVDKDFILPEHIKGKSAMDRLLITSALIDINKVIYLDIDLIVNSDISQIYNLDTGQKGICGRVCNKGDYANIRGMVRAWGNNDFRILDSFSLPVNKEINNCFNSGVMLMNLDTMRKNNFEDMAIKMVNKYPLIDQFILNLYTNGKHTELPASWNYFPSQDANKMIEKNIIHWIGPEKPWNSLPPLHELWLKYYKGSKTLLIIKNIFLKMIRPSE